MQKSELALILIMMLGSAFLGGMGAVGYYDHFLKNQGLDIPSVRTKSITIASGANSSRLEMGLTRDKSPFMRLLDEDSQIVVDFGIHENDSPSIRIGRSEKDVSGSEASPAELGVDESGVPFLLLRHPGRGGQAYHGFTENNEPLIRLTNAKGGMLHFYSTLSSIGVEVLDHKEVPLVFVGYDKGVPNVSLYNPYLNNMCGLAANQSGTILSFLNSDLQERIVMGLLGQDTPSLKILDETSQPSFVVAPLGQGGEPLALEFRDQAGRRRAVFGMGENGQPVMDLYDEGGKSLLK